MLGSFNFFGKEIGYYPLMALIGALTAGVFCFITAKKRGLNEVKMVFLLLFSAIGIFLGGHILFGITNIGIFGAFLNVKDFSQFLYVFTTIFGGQVFYGGLIGGIIAGSVYAKATRLNNFADYTDIAAAAIPLFHCFGRIGCFLGGCCYGIESEFGFTFEHALIEQANGVNRFPVQLLEAGFNLALFLVLWQLLRKNKLKNHLLSLYLIVYPIGRFCFEFLRGDEYRGFLFGLSTSQIISILLIIGTVAYELYRKFFKKNKPETEAREAE